MKKNKVLKSCMAILLTGTFLSSCASITKVFSDSPIEINEYYEYGSKFSIPDKYFANNVLASHKIIYPNGEASLASQIDLNLAGKYSLVYYAYVDNEYYEETYDFTVKIKNFITQETSLVTYNVEPKSGIKGLLFDSAADDTLDINSKIDLSSATKSSPFMEMLVVPESLGAFDFSNFKIVLTDSMDNSNQMTINIARSTSDVPYMSYCLVAGDNQPLTGYEAWNNTLHKNTWGTPFAHDFAGIYDGVEGVGPFGTNTIKLAYDKEENAFYVNNALVADFDDPFYFSESWNGFKTGIVSAKIICSEFASSKAHLLFKSVKDVDFSIADFIDKDSPELNLIDAFDEMPNAKVGHTYPLFDATAFDAFSGECDVKRSVYYLNGNKKINIKENADNTFNVDKEGTYQITYEAKDYFRNVASKTLTVKTDDIADININVNTTYPEEIKLGSVVNAPEISISGGVGGYKTKYYYEFNGAKNEFSDSFVPQDAGDYKLIVEVKDKIGLTSKEEINFKAISHNDVIFNNNPVLPRFFILNSPYKIERFQGAIYETGHLENKDCVLTVTNGTLDNNVYIPLEEGEATFTYSLNDFERIVKVPVIDVRDDEGYLDLRKYFYSENNVEFVSDSKNITASFNDLDDNSLTFINPLLAYNLSFVLSNGDKPNYRGIDFVLTDSIANKSVTLSIDTKNMVASLNNGKQTSIVYDFEKENEQMLIQYNNGVISFNTYNFVIDKYDDGLDFEGFKSNKVYVSIVLKECESLANIKINYIDGHMMNDASNDYIGPKVVLIDEFKASVDPSSKVNIPRVLYSDVLDPNCSAKLLATFNADYDQILISNDGVKLENVDPSISYSLTLDKIGQYLFEVEANDTFRKNKTKLSYAINVEDNIAPTLTLTSEVVKNAKVGDTWVIPTFEVKDNHSQKCRIVSYIVTPIGETIYFKENTNAIVFKNKGIYHFVAMAIDEAGNVGKLEADIVVTE